MSCPSEEHLAEAAVISDPTVNPTQAQPEPPMSKNKLKKLLRDQKWAAGREKRKELRKIKAKEKKEMKRAARDIHPPEESTHEKRKASVEPESQPAKKPRHQKSLRLPVSFVIDCDFDDLMRDGERTSLASQLTRSYSENQKAPFRPHLFVSSFGGLLKQRFDTVLSSNHLSWKGVQFLEGDFEAAASQAGQIMQIDQRAQLAGAFQKDRTTQEIEGALTSGEVVYLTSDSPETLTELKPYSTYIIGGLVDKNRHKGICYKRAKDRGVKTGKLPIGDYMKMASRFVLATNHVVEIMLRWLEVGDWGKAFIEVIPQRKGGVLKDGISVLDKAPTTTHDEANVGGPAEQDQEERTPFCNDVDGSLGGYGPGRGSGPC
ncbi:MAG: hypothetical protein Q9166_000756 [cf. Caloplaca sp. 2 TL-2023]